MREIGRAIWGNFPVFQAIKSGLTGWLVWLLKGKIASLASWGRACWGFG